MWMRRSRQSSGALRQVSKKGKALPEKQKERLPVTMQNKPTRLSVAEGLLGGLKRGGSRKLAKE
jgi:hypothetical protein